MPGGEGAKQRDRDKSDTRSQGVLYFLSSFSVGGGCDIDRWNQIKFVIRYDRFVCFVNTQSRSSVSNYYNYLPIYDLQ